MSMFVSRKDRTTYYNMSGVNENIISLMFIVTNIIIERL